MTHKMSCSTKSGLDCNCSVPGQVARELEEAVTELLNPVCAVCEKEFKVSGGSHPVLSRIAALRGGTLKAAHSQAGGRLKSRNTHTVKHVESWPPPNSTPTTKKQGITISVTLKEIILKAVYDALARNKWHRKKAAKELGCCERSMTAYIARMRKAGTHVPRNTTPGARRIHTHDKNCKCSRTKCRLARRKPTAPLTKKYCQTHGLAFKWQCPKCPQLFAKRKKPWPN